jgi:hypothetical protein
MKIDNLTYSVSDLSEVANLNKHAGFFNLTPIERQGGKWRKSDISGYRDLVSFDLSKYPKILIMSAALSLFLYYLTVQAKRYRTEF